MGITLLMRELPLSVVGFRENTNTEALNLLLNVSTSDDNEFWGRVPFPKYDSSKDPSFLVFRKHNEDITKQQVEVLSCYCRDVLDRGLEQPEEWTWEEEDKEAVLDVFCSSEMFGEYFKDFKEKKLEQGDKTWVDATPPSGMRSTSIIEEDEELDAKNRRPSSPTDEEDEDSEFGRLGALAHAKEIMASE